MSNVQKVSVALTPEIIAMLKEAVETGEYTSASEVVRDALRMWKARRVAQEMDAEELRRLWQEGIESGRSVEGEMAFSRLRDKYAKYAAAERTVWLFRNAPSPISSGSAMTSRCIIHPQRRGLSRLLQDFPRVGTVRDDSSSYF